MKKRTKRKIKRTLFVVVIELFIIAAIIFLFEMDNENDQVFHAIKQLGLGRKAL